MNIKLSVIVPSYNESWEIKKMALDEINSCLATKDFSYEVVIVDDGSTNGTVNKVREEVKKRRGFNFIENPHGGKAITVMTGLLRSKGEIALFTDMDQATPISELDKFLPLFEKGFDVVIGSRHGRKGAPLMRKLAGLGFSLIRNVILGLPFKDTQCGFKAFNRKSIEIIFPDLLKMWQAMKSKNAAVNAGFDVETLFIAKKKDLVVAEVDVDWRHVENLKQVQLIKDSIEALKDMLRIKWNDFSGRYN